MRQILTSFALAVVGLGFVGQLVAAEELFSPGLNASGFDGAVVLLDGESQTWYSSEQTWLDSGHSCVYL